MQVIGKVACRDCENLYDVEHGFRIDLGIDVVFCRKSVCSTLEITSGTGPAVDKENPFFIRYYA